MAKIHDDLVKKLVSFDWQKSERTEYENLQKDIATHRDLNLLRLGLTEIATDPDIREMQIAGPLVTILATTASLFLGTRSLFGDSGSAAIWASVVFFSLMIVALVSLAILFTAAIFRDSRNAKRAARAGYWLEQFPVPGGFASPQREAPPQEPLAQGPERPSF